MTVRQSQSGDIAEQHTTDHASRAALGVLIMAGLVGGLGIGQNRLALRLPLTLSAAGGVAALVIANRRARRGVADQYLLSLGLLCWSAQALWPLLPVPLFVAIVAFKQGRLGRRHCRDISRIASLRATVLLSTAAVAGCLWWLAHRPQFAWYSGFSILSNASPLPVRWAAIILIALVNAIAEECWWRDALPCALTELGASLTTTTVITSMSFGLAHLKAVPGGALGMLLTAAFSVAAVLANRYSGTLYCSVTAHAAADVTLILVLLRAS